MLPVEGRRDMASWCLPRHSMPLKSSGAASSRSCTSSRNTCSRRKDMQQDNTHVHVRFQAASASDTSYSESMYALRGPAQQSHNYLADSTVNTVGHQNSYLAQCHHGVGDEGDAQAQCSHQRVAAHELSSLRHQIATQSCLDSTPR